MVPRLLTPEQNEIRRNICADILQNIENDPDFLENIITRMQLLEPISNLSFVSTDYIAAL